eukprot:scaffold165040_cov27-Tisochrysis_lutea.AAC.3
MHGVLTRAKCARDGRLNKECLGSDTRTVGPERSRHRATLARCGGEERKQAEDRNAVSMRK